MIRRICRKCQKEYTPTAAGQKYCGSWRNKTGCSYKIYKKMGQNYYNKVKNNPDFRQKERIRAIEYNQRAGKRKRNYCRCYLCPIHGIKVSTPNNKINEKD